MYIAQELYSFFTKYSNLANSDIYEIKMADINGSIYSTL